MRSANPCQHTAEQRFLIIRKNIFRIFWAISCVQFPIHQNHSPLTFATHQSARKFFECDLCGARAVWQPWNVTTRPPAEIPASPSPLSNKWNSASHRWHDGGNPWKQFGIARHDARKPNKVSPLGVSRNYRPHRGFFFGVRSRKKNVANCPPRAHSHYFPTLAMWFFIRRRWSHHEWKAMFVQHRGATAVSERCFFAPCSVNVFKKCN